jgi:hypothetical protein
MAGEARRANTIWTKPSLDEPKYATFGQHCVRHNQKNDRESHGDGYELEANVDQCLHLLSIANCQLPIVSIAEGCN